MSIVPKSEPYAKPIIPQVPAATPKKDSLGYVGEHKTPKPLSTDYYLPPVSFDDDFQFILPKTYPRIDGHIDVAGRAVAERITESKDGINLHAKIIKTSDGKTILHIKPETIQTIPDSEGFRHQFFAFLDEHKLSRIVPEGTNKDGIYSQDLVTLDDTYIDLSTLDPKPKKFTLIFQYAKPKSDHTEEVSYIYKTVTLDYGT